MNATGTFTPVSIETVDRAIRDWFDKTVDARVETAEGQWVKVPVVFSQGERWAINRAFRDSNGVLILPIIALRRTGIDPDNTRMALGAQTEYIQVSKEIDPKTNQVMDLENQKVPPWQRKYPPIFDVYTVPFPNSVIANYQIVVQTQYISQMNTVLEKIWKSLDIQKSFVAPFDNDGRKPPRANQYGFADPYQPPKKLDNRYVVGLLETTRAPGDNFEEFTDTERIIKYTTECMVPCVLQSETEGSPPEVQVQRTAYKVVLRQEDVKFVDDPAELDRIFGPLK